MTTIDEKLYQIEQLYALTSVNDLILDLIKENNNFSPFGQPEFLSNNQTEQLLKTHLFTIELLLKSILGPAVNYYEVYYKKTKDINKFLTLYMEKSNQMFVIRVIKENKNKIYLAPADMSSILDTNNNISCFIENLVFDKHDSKIEWQNNPNPLFEKYYNKDFYPKLKKIKDSANIKLKELLDITDDSELDNFLRKKPTEQDYYGNYYPRNVEINEIIKKKEDQIYDLFSQRFSEFNQKKKKFMENPKTNLNDIFTTLKYLFDVDVSLFEFFTEYQNDIL